MTIPAEPTPERCPECDSDCLYGPVSDYWGVCCVECGYELRECAATREREAGERTAEKRTLPPCEMV